MNRREGFNRWVPKFLPERDLNYKLKLVSNDYW